MDDKGAVVRCENENATEQAVLHRNQEDKIAIENLCAENFNGNQFRLILQDQSDSYYCGFHVTIHNSPGKCLIKAVPETKQCVQNFSSFISLRSAEAKLISSYLRLTDYTNIFGALFLPVTLKDFVVESASDYPAKLRNSAKDKIKFAIYRRYADYLTDMEKYLSRM